MDFFEAQAQARARSQRLLWVFAAVVLLVPGGRDVFDALGHGFVGRDVDEQLGCLSGESEAAQYSSDQQRFFHGDSR